MAKPIGWKAFYDGGREFASQDTAWRDLPMHGLLVAVEFYGDGTRQKFHTKDYYVLEPDKLYGTNDLHPYLEKQGDVKMGRWAGNEEFATAIRRADEAVP